jgi:tetratricopeptide (TPR) repeat protein
MEFPLEGMGMRRALPVAALATAALLIYPAAKIWIASRQIHSGRLDRMERGAALVPGDGDAWDRLGRFEQFDFANPDSSRAIADYRKAIGDDPLSAYYWMDLASAYEDTGDLMRAADAYNQSRNAYPASALVAWNYGNFLLRQQDYPEAYAQIRLAIERDRSLLPIAISRTWRSSGDVNQLIGQVLPADPDAYLQALDFLASIQQTDAAVALWQRLAAMGKPFALPPTFPFFGELIRTDRGDDAHRAWPQALGAAGLPHDEPANHSLIWDGGFAADFANGGLGWRWDSPIGAEMDFDSAPPASGARALRLDFNGGTNLALDGPSQYVPVEPASAFHFHALMRTDQISTDSGIRFSIMDPNRPGEAALLTNNFIGTHSWTAVDADVTTSADTHFLLVRVFRNPSQFFDNKLSGTAWIADVSLVPSRAPGAQPLP